MSTALPNVIVMVIDDATVEDVRYMPKVQSLPVNKGTTFAHNYVPLSVCCPARATILTGQYPHNHGVLDNTPPRGGFPAFDDTNTLATYLDPVYATSLVGTYLNSMPDEMYIPPGWDDWRSPLNGSTYNYRLQNQNVNGVMTTFSGYMPETHGRQSRGVLQQCPLESAICFLRRLGCSARGITARTS